MYYKEWLRDWLELYMKPSTKDKTYTQYSQIIEQRLIPKFGNSEINDLTPMMIQQYVAELLVKGNFKTGKGLSPNSINAIIVVIQNSLKAAHLFGFADKYDMDRVKRPKINEKKIKLESNISKPY